LLVEYGIGVVLAIINGKTGLLLLTNQTDTNTDTATAQMAATE
jgi:hypothetical protein